MPRGRKKQTALSADTVAEVTPSEVAASTPEPQDQQPAVAEQPPFEPTGNYSPTTEDMEAVAREGKGRFRSWATAAKHSYAKLTDDERQKLILQFEHKPSDDVLTAIKGAGFQFQPEYHGLKQVWTRRNDFEGRLQVEAIETLIRERDAKTPER